MGDDRALARPSRWPSRFASARKPRTRASCVARISGPQSRSSIAGPTLSAAKREPELFQHLLVAWPLDQEAAARRAGLARVLHDRVDDRRQRRVEIGVGEDDLRSLAAQLQRDGAVALRRFGGDARAGRGRAGERQMLDARMRGERRAGLAAEPGDDVERAFGEADPRRELGDAQERQAGVLGRLHDARIAGGERSADRAAEDLQRIVPRDDVARDAVRLAPRQHRVAGRIRNRLARELVGGAAVELEVARARRDIGARLAQRLAAVARLDQRELVGVIEYFAPEPRRAAGPSRRARGAPRRRRAPARPRAPPGRCRARRRTRWRRTACRPTDRSSATSRRSPAATQRLPMKCDGGVVIGDSGSGAFMAADVAARPVTSPRRAGTSRRACSRRCAART